MIEIVDLTEQNLVAAPEWPSHPFSCKFCLYWEFPEECTDPTREAVVLAPAEPEPELGGENPVGGEHPCRNEDGHR